MSKIIIDASYQQQLSELDAQITRINTAKLKLIFEVLSITPHVDDFKKLMDWDLILVSVMDKQMAVQLNKLCAYMPNLKFVVAPERDLFSYYPGGTSRRVWKER